MPHPRPITSPPTRSTGAELAGNERALDGWDAVAWLLLFATGLALVLEVGRRGFMPLDQSIVFSGAWRIHAGQVPFRDVLMPAGLVPSALQSLFFGVLGVTWFSYVLHAAVVNGLFGVLVFQILRTLGLGTAAAFVYGALSTVVFYPPFGVPYLEQHAFFFGALTLYLVVLACRDGVSGAHPDERPFRPGPMVLAPVALALAFLSKPVPTVFIGALVLVVALVHRSRVRFLSRLGAGTVGTVVLGGVLMGLLGVTPGQVWHSLFELPLATGSGRLDVFGDPVSLLAAILDNAPAFGLRTLPLWFVGLAVLLLSAATGLSKVWTRVATGGGLAAFVGVAAGSAVTGSRAGLAAAGAMALVVLGVVAAARTRAWREAEPGRVILRALGERWLALVLSVGAMGLGLLSSVLTSNAPVNSAALVFLAVGALHAVVPDLPGRRGRLAGASLVALLLAGSVADATLLHVRVNRPRTIHDIVMRGDGRSTGVEQLSFMRWAVSDVYDYSAEDFRKVVEFLRERDAPFFLVGDATILYPLTGVVPADPVLWFHPGLGFPAPDSEAFPRFEADLVERLREREIRYVVLEEGGGWFGVRLRHFPRLEAAVEARTCRSVTFGGFTVEELCPHL